MAKAAHLCTPSNVFLFCFLQHSETHTYADINMQAWEDSRHCSGLNVQNANNAKVIMLFHNSLLCFVVIFGSLRCFALLNIVVKNRMV